MDDRLAVDVVDAERLTSVSRWRKYIKLGPVAELERIARSRAGAGLSKLRGRKRRRG